MQKSDFFVNEYGKLCVTDREGTIVLTGVILYEGYRGRQDLVFISE